MSLQALPFLRWFKIFIYEFPFSRATFLPKESPGLLAMQISDDSFIDTSARNLTFSLVVFRAPYHIISVDPECLRFDVSWATFYPHPSGLLDRWYTFLFYPLAFLILFSWKQQLLNTALSRELDFRYSVYCRQKSILLFQWEC